MKLQPAASGRFIQANAKPRKPARIILEMQMKSPYFRQHSAYFKAESAFF